MSEVPPRFSPPVNIPLERESVVDFWESVHDGWPGKCYSDTLVGGLLDLMRALERKGHHPIRNILDLGAGVGNPSIGLAKHGYKIVAVDKDPSMVARFQDNARHENVKISALHRDWTSLLVPEGAQEIHPGSFDFALCRGNSLIYAGSWETSDFIETAATATLILTLRNIFRCLRRGGVLYVDISSRAEYSGQKRHFESIGAREFKQQIINIYWYVRYDFSHKKRVVEAFRVFHSRDTLLPARITHHRFVSFHLPHTELLRLAQMVGFTCIEQYVPVSGESHYDVFLFKKD